MRSIGCALLISLLLAVPALAQVINGESTYSDSDLHQPPADDARADTVKTDDRSQQPGARQDQPRH